MSPLHVLFLLLATAFVSASRSEETFSETLTIRPLPDGKVNARFEFITHINQSISNGHSTLSPAPILSLLRKHGATAFELALTAGVWDHSRWGYPLGETGGTGAELWAWMGESSHSDSRHDALTQSLSGLFCASLGQSLTNSFTTRPHIPHLTSKFEPVPYHTTSPPSGLCTENLTPFIKLLPSKGQSGLSGLLKSHRVLASNWHSMSVRARGNTSPVSFGVKGENIEITLGFEVVWDLIGRNKGMGLRELSFSKTFESPLPAVFPPVSTSELIVLVPEEESQDWSLAPDSFARDSKDGIDYIRWDLKKVGSGFDFIMKHKETGTFVFPSTYRASRLTVERSVLGSDQTEGAFKFDLTNRDNVQKEAVLLEEWPWWVGGWLGERKIQVDGHLRNDLFSSVSYTPSIPHERPTTLLSHLILPPNSTLEIYSPFLKQFLQYNEHLPDASRGFELCGAILFPLDGEGAAELPNRIYTGNVLIDLATPDFSMPYNVIIMSCTLLALLFGSIFNTLTRRLVAIDSEDIKKDVKSVDGMEEVER